MTDDGTHHIDVTTVDETEETAFLDSLPGVKAVNIEAFEEDFGKKLDQAVATHETQMELRRLEKTRDQISVLEERIRSSGKLAPARLGKLYDRLDELKEEEQNILDRIASVPDISESNGKEKVGPPQNERPRAIAPPLKRARQREVEEEGEEEGEEDIEEFGEDVVEDDFSDEAYRTRVEWWLAELDSTDGYDVSKLFEKLPMAEQVATFGETVPMDGFQCPKILYDKLLEYQQAGLKWLLGLFSRRVGGILGDEMVLDMSHIDIYIVRAWERHCK